ncbi:hypothetical protein IMG5_119340 [Ichthyophthirius multifiliis]|uniref:D-aminoacyl-tRNA deacylase n=1 Tax=Ichthyophthirius multifiliis TaxID=5932 RepID=G0QUU2_ICHMU|nr:hypothetical protein IMG5_119340 [Ichthyophthirius multifiliis]EGR31022.1 hypothetical protein IMG5_119340 [Ichthyophthirius multifiliis]|eukprot:XP_004034508.1 hypothetical protein IMG5_119340 [Ichthyophthirius multifiliis]
MRLIIQRVLSAGVKVDGEFISQIGPGICILLGLHKGDSLKHVDKWAEKVLKLKLWPQQDKNNINLQKNEEIEQKQESRQAGGWKSSVLDNNFEVLIVSNFTLYGVLKGNKPDFHDSMKADEAKNIYEYFIKKMQNIYKPEKIKGGKFSTLYECPY